MDLLQSGDERDAVPLGERLRGALAAGPPRWAVAELGLVLVGALAGGVVAVREQRQAQAREAVRLDVEVLPAGASSTTVGGVARGAFSVLLVNRRDRPVRLGELRLTAEPAARAGPQVDLRVVLDACG